jgi:hypothetical protein
MAISKDEFVRAATGLHNQCKQLIDLLGGRLPELEKAVVAGDLNTIRNAFDALKGDYAKIVAANDWISG